MKTVLLLLASNVFMTVAWYGHLKFKGVPIWIAILASWGIAFFEYCLQVPANRYGYLGGFSAFQLKIIQEVITLVVFLIFAVLWLKETPRWNHAVAFALVLAAVWFAFLSGDPRAATVPPEGGGERAERAERAAAVTTWIWALLTLAATRGARRAADRRPRSRRRHRRSGAPRARP